MLTNMSKFDQMMAEANLLNPPKNDFENDYDESRLLVDPLYADCLEFAFENVRRRTDIESVNLK